MQEIKICHVLYNGAYEPLKVTIVPYFTKKRNACSPEIRELKVKQVHTSLNSKQSSIISPQVVKSNIFTEKNQNLEK